MRTLLRIFLSISLPLAAVVVMRHGDWRSDLPAPAPPAAVTPSAPESHENRIAPLTPTPEVRATDFRVEQTAEGLVSYSGWRTPRAVQAAHAAQINGMVCGDAHASNPEELDDWHRLDLDGDGQDEYLAFVTLEGFGGGNNYSRYLIVYRYVRPVWFASQAALVGGKDSVQVIGDRLRLADGVLSMDARFRDETCCEFREVEIRMDVGIGATLSPRAVDLNDRTWAGLWALGFLARCLQ